MYSLSLDSQEATEMLRVGASRWCHVCKPSIPIAVGASTVRCGQVRRWGGGGGRGRRFRVVFDSIDWTRTDNVTRNDFVSEAPVDTGGFVLLCLLRSVQCDFASPK